MKKTILSIFAALFALTLSCGASAAGQTSGTISGVIAVNWACSGCVLGATLVIPSGTSTGQPSCATSQQYAVDSTTASGKNVVATLLLAFAAGRTVSIFGDGTCSVWADRESIQSVQMN